MISLTVFDAVRSARAPAAPANGKGRVELEAPRKQA
jgi:hypothetical protein